MKIINEIKHYTAKEVGMLVGRTHLTIHLWDKWSDELEGRGEVRLIPSPLKLGKQGTRYWAESDIPKIKLFADNIQRGDLAEFSKRQWSSPEKKGNRRGRKPNEQKIANCINEKKNLSIEDKLVYALVIFSQSMSNNETISLDKIHEHLDFSNDKIHGAVSKLLELQLIKEEEDGFKYI